MQETDKFRTDLDKAVRRARKLPGVPVDPEALREFFYRSFATVPQDSLAALFSCFAGKSVEDEAAALEWLAAVGSILLMDYNEQPLSPEDWREIRDDISLCSDEIDLDLLSYVMTLVVDHGAIH